MVFCRYCGKDIPGGSKFCPECGETLVDSGQVEQQQPVPFPTVDHPHVEPPEAPSALPLPSSIVQPPPPTHPPPAPAPKAAPQEQVQPAPPLTPPPQPSPLPPEPVDSTAELPKKGLMSIGMIVAVVAIVVVIMVVSAYFYYVVLPEEEDEPRTELEIYRAGITSTYINYALSATVDLKVPLDNIGNTDVNYKMIEVHVDYSLNGVLQDEVEAIPFDDSIFVSPGDMLTASIDLNSDLINSGDIFLFSITVYQALEYHDAYSLELFAQ